MSEDAGEKSEEPSEKRREEFRERGEVARSKDAVSVLVLFCAVAYFLGFGPTIYDRFRDVLVHFLDLRAVVEMTPESAVRLTNDQIFLMVALLAPLVGMLVFVSIFGNVAQVGMLFTTKPLEPDLNKLNFFTKFIPTFFSKQAVGNLFLSLGKIALIASVIWGTLDGDQDRIRSLATLPLSASMRYLIERSMQMLLNVCLVLIVIAIMDYFWSRYTMEEKMKMTRQELKDEAKEYEGNPHMKGAMKRRARDIVNKKMKAAVPTADVIVNNPTHISIALRYRQGVDAAPVVVAKGADLMAMQIRKIATEHGVPMVENVPLARMLYKHVKVGRPIPAQFYRAVAEVLAYVFRLRAKRPARRAPTPGQPQVRRLDTSARDRARVA
ncbi:MAG: flagellar biosynthesis protein FlhB [Bradymonadia bacterium]|jgi:flagellar biosynthetic protein FlhB